MAHKWQRALKQQFKTQAALERMIGEYFDDCESEGVAYTKIGLNNWLGIHRQNVYDWGNAKDKKKQKFSYTLKAAYDYMEQKLWESLAKEHGNSTKHLFALKCNFKVVEEEKILALDKVDTSEKVIVNVGGVNNGPNKITD